MNGFAIIKLEADAVATKEDVLAHFNEFIQRAHSTPSFIRESEGYFRITYDDKTGISSAAVEAFGKFLETSGYTINGISTASASEKELSTEISFSKGGTEAHVTVSTVNVY